MTALQRRNSFLVLFLIFLFIGNVFFLKYNAFRTFNFYDMGFGLDGGWRILNGQRPYLDFIYFSGPIHLYLNAFFFKLFGFGKSAVLAHLVAVHTLVILCIFLMAYKRVPVFATIAVTILAMTSFYWSIAHPWHNQTAQLWGILAVTLLISQLPLTSPKKALWTTLGCGILVIFALMTKTNVGVGYGILFLAILLVSPKPVASLQGYAIGILLGLVLAALFIRHPQAYIEQSALYGQLMAGERLSRLLNPMSWFTNHYWIPFLIVLLNVFPYARKMKEHFALLLGMMFLAIFSIYSSDILIEANIFLWGLFMAVAFVVIYRISDFLMEPWRKRMFQISTGLLITITFYFIIVSVQHGLQLKVWTYGEKDPRGTYALKTEAFQGWRVEERRGKVLDQLVEFVTMNIPKEETLLVVTDMQILYALTQRDSYRGVPILIMKKGHMPIPGKQLQKVRKSIKNNPPDWIVTDMASYLSEIPYLGLDRDGGHAYRIAKELGPYAVFQKENEQ